MNKECDGFNIKGNSEPPKGLMEKLILEGLCRDGLITKQELKRALEILNKKK